MDVVKFKFINLYVIIVNVLGHYKFSPNAFECKFLCIIKGLSLFVHLYQVYLIYPDSDITNISIDCIVRGVNVKV